MAQSITPDRSFSNNQQTYAFDSKTQINQNLLGPNVKVKKVASPKRKMSLKEGKKKVEQKIKTVFN